MCVCVCVCAEGTPVSANVQLFQRDVDNSLCLTTPSPITDVHRLNPSMQSITWLRKYVGGREHVVAGEVLRVW